MLDPGTDVLFDHHAIRSTHGQLFAAHVALVHHLEHARLRPGRGRILQHTGKTRILVAHRLQPGNGGSPIDLGLPFHTLGIGRITGFGYGLMSQQHGSGTNQLYRLCIGIRVVLAKVIQAVSPLVDLLLHVLGESLGILAGDLAVRLAALRGVHGGFQGRVLIQKGPCLVCIRVIGGNHSGGSNRAIQLLGRLLTPGGRYIAQQTVPFGQFFRRAVFRVIKVLMIFPYRRLGLTRQLTAQGAQQALENRIFGSLRGWRCSSCRAGLTVFDTARATGRCVKFARGQGKGDFGQVFRNRKAPKTTGATTGT
ncbi:hypothetical protein ALQ47_05247 [Pseudomonas cichorii]|nr:hypothetical protein ALQ47_05247 [Pseudomonas cichorii]